MIDAHNIYILSLDNLFQAEMDGKNGHLARLRRLADCQHRARPALELLPDHLSKDWIRKPHVVWRKWPRLNNISLLGIVAILPVTALPAATKPAYKGLATHAARMVLHGHQIFTGGITAQQLDCPRGKHQSEDQLTVWQYQQKHGKRRRWCLPTGSQLPGREQNSQQANLKQQVVPLVSEKLTTSRAATSQAQRARWVRGRRLHQLRKQASGKYHCYLARKVSGISDRLLFRAELGRRLETHVEVRCRDCQSVRRSGAKERQ